MRFKDVTMNRIYELYMLTPPEGSGTDFTHAYKIGRANPDLRCLYPRDSLAYAVWAAGRDTARQEQKQVKNKD